MFRNISCMYNYLPFTEDKTETRGGKAAWQNWNLGVQSSHPVLFPLSHTIHIKNEKIICLGGREQEGGECVWTCTSGGKTFGRREKRVKQSASLLSRFLPLLHRAKYFHGKKVNGEIEIRVEQVGWS